MIQIKYKTQGPNYLLTIRRVMLDGMEQFCKNSCNSSQCKGCAYYSACADIHRAITHIDNLLLDENRKL